MLRLILTNENQLDWANRAAQAALGIPETGCPNQLAKVFGTDSLYQQIEQAAFNYRWSGRLPVLLPDGSQMQFQGRASWVTNERWVFNQVLLEGELVPAITEWAMRGELDQFALRPDQLRKVYEISTSINSNLDFQSICADVTRKAAELVGADRSLLFNVTDKEIGVFARPRMNLPR